MNVTRALSIFCSFCSCECSQSGKVQIKFVQAMFPRLTTQTSRYECWHVLNYLLFVERHAFTLTELFTFRPDF